MGLAAHGAFLRGSMLAAPFIGLAGEPGFDLRRHPSVSRRELEGTGESVRLHQDVEGRAGALEQGQNFVARE